MEIDIQPKAKVFAWRLYHDLLPSGTNLMKKGIDVADGCPVCGYKFESTSHTIIYCWWAQSFWRRLGVNCSFLDYTFDDIGTWLWYCLVNNSSEASGLFIQGARMIWFNRNNALHGKNMKCPIEAALTVKNGGVFWSVCKDKIVVTDFSESRIWVPPADGVTKLNIDGSWEAQNNVAGVGFCGRDSKGAVWLTGAKWLEEVRSCLEAEGKALQWAMEIAAIKGLKKALFEIDCAELMNLIMRGPSMNDKSLESFEWCRRMLISNADWSMRLVSRDANQCADFLANKARLQQWSWMDFEVIPIHLSEVL